MRNVAARFVVLAIAVAPAIAPCARYPELDSTYAGTSDGIARVAFEIGGDFADYGSTGTMLPDGRLVMAGTVRTVANDRDFGFAGLTQAGFPDSTFGPSLDGKVLVGMAPVNGIAHVVETQDGHLLYFGAPSSTTAIVGRMDSAGGVDTTFNGNGRRLFDGGFFLDAATSLSPNGLVSLPGGKILITGYAGSTTTVCAAAGRLNPDGSTDTTFGAGRGSVCVAPAQQTTEAAGSYAVAVQPDGRILLAGTALHPGGSGLDMSVARLTADGVLDTTFGPAHDGWAFVAFDQGGALGDWAYAITVDRSGRIILAGQVEKQADYDIGVARLLPDGLPDTTFGTNGKLQIDFGIGGANNDTAHSVFVLPDQHILIGGWSQKNSTVGTAVLLTSNGQLEHRFGNGGLFLQADPDAEESAVLISQRLLLSGDYMVMVGSIISPILQPGGVRNYDFGATRYVLPLFSDDFEGDAP